MRDSGPTYVVQVAEGIDVEDVGEARRNAQILDETGEHVPRVALNGNRLSEKKTLGRKEQVADARRGTMR
jgi:hypothetical protein